MASSSETPSPPLVPPPPAATSSPPPPPIEDDSSPPPPESSPPPPLSPSPPPPSPPSHKSSPPPPPPPPPPSPPPPASHDVPSPPPPIIPPSSPPPPPHPTPETSPASLLATDLPPPATPVTVSPPIVPVYTPPATAIDLNLPQVLPPPIASETPPSPVGYSPATVNRSHPAPGALSPAQHEVTISNSQVAVIAGIMAAGAVAIAFVIFFCVANRNRRRKIHYIDSRGRSQGRDTHLNDPSKWNNVQCVVDTGKDGGLWTAPGPILALSTCCGGLSSAVVEPSSPIGTLGTISRFACEELATATNGFSQANLLGQGGFGFVHKGTLSDGKVVAVKSLKSDSGQGEREFQAEVEIISRVHHRHLVSLVGYCIANGRRMLVYEFVPNNTLEFHLHGKDQPVMKWETRLRIAVGSAKGLAYLHEDCNPRIIHRDIKAANILIDNNFEAKVADFGLAKLTSDNNTHVSTRVMGTFGYLAPEYATSGKLTEKSDVFSFGVMLLELITGRRPLNPSIQSKEDCLVDWARPLLAKAIENGNLDELVDPRLECNYNPQEMARMVACAAATIRHSAKRRPKMSQIVRALARESAMDELNEEGKGGGHSALYHHPIGQREGSYDTAAYNADMMKFREMVMATTKEFNTSEDCETSSSS